MGNASENDRQKAPEMGRQAASGALFLGASQAARFVLSVATTVIVARILTPGDYGVIAMWSPVFAFVLLFQDFGFSTATVQAKSLSNEQSTSLFFVNVLASIGIAAALLVGAQFVGDFYGDSRVAWVTAASASIVLVSGLSIQHAALLNREMRFRALAVIGVAAALTNAVATIALALYLGSYWALFFGTLVSAVVQTLLTWTLSRWMPGRRASYKDTRDLLGFGTHVAIFNLVNFLSRNADNVLIGKVWGAAPLGLYDRSYKLMMTPLQFINTPLSRVMLPVLSRLVDEPRRFRNAYLHSIRAILLATAPLGAVAAAASEEMVFVLLGPKWQAAAPVFFWLALVMIYQPAASSLGWLFISRGRSRAYAAWGIFSSVVTVGSFVVGLSGGPVGVARAYLFANILIALLLMIGATRDSPVRAAELIKSALPLLIAAGLSWLLARSVDDLLTPFALILVSIPAAYLIALAVLWLSPDGRHSISELIRLVRSDNSPQEAERRANT